MEIFFRRKLSFHITSANCFIALRMLQRHERLHLFYSNCFNLFACLNQEFEKNNPSSYKTFLWIEKVSRFECYWRSFMRKTGKNIWLKGPMFVQMVSSDETDEHGILKYANRTAQKCL